MINWLKRRVGHFLKDVSLMRALEDENCEVIPYKPEIFKHSFIITFDAKHEDIKATCRRYSVDMKGDEK